MITLTARDALGQADPEAHREVYKTRMGRDGGPIAAPYRQKIRRVAEVAGLAQKLRAVHGEGCTMTATLWVNKVAGKIEFHPQALSAQTQQEVGDKLSLDVSHTVHSLLFREATTPASISSTVGGKGLQPVRMETAGVTSYHVEVIPTAHGSQGAPIQPYDYLFTAARDFAPRKVVSGDSLPAVRVHYTLSSLVLLQSPVQQSFSYFVAHCCAVIGGVFTVMGMLDSVVERILLYKHPNLGLNEERSQEVGMRCGGVNVPPHSPTRSRPPKRATEAPPTQRRMQPPPICTS